MGKLKYTFDDYINNPSGKGSAVNVAINREQFEKELMNLESKNSKSTYNIYRQNIKGETHYYIHFIIPSTTNGFFHDVVIEMNPPKNDSSSIKTIKAYTTKFFSNDNNFVFTYAYTFKTHGVLISELESLLPFRSIVQKPAMRNPDNAMGYNKYIIFAYIIMQRDKLFEKDNLNRNAKNAGYNIIKSSIKSFEKKEQERNKITQEAKQAARKEKTGSKIIKSKNLLGDTPQTSKISKIVKSARKSSIVSSVKKIKKR